MPIHERSLAESSIRSDVPLMGTAGSGAGPHQEGGPVSEDPLPGAASSTSALHASSSSAHLLRQLLHVMRASNGWGQLAILETLLERFSFKWFLRPEDRLREAKPMGALPC